MMPRLFQGIRAAAGRRRAMPGGRLSRLAAGGLLGALLGAALLAPLPPGALAADEHSHETPRPPHAGLSFQRMFGSFDRAAAQRGLQVYREVCSNCHSLRLLSYRNLRQIGLSDAEVRAVAAAVQVQDGPNDEGAMFERPGRPSDRFRSPFPNEQAARAANNGALPPDLSLIVKAREDGANYVHALLTGYADPPAGVTLQQGMNYNTFFPGHQIAMAPPLTAAGQVQFPNMPDASVDQMARDVTTFLAWAAEPELEARRAMGVRIVIFLCILAGLAYAVKRKVWADAH
ncbi:cytochrome c1 [Roseomonas sp. NAR14]|uniref:Cytochrome c1 n=1 Tax=Roseomonas acroporae TaxID=2937791 RepID=A0A9X1YBB0_9PROT|nr:cytochrome c1 [Roseomonas acroporae]MCK8785522.1 cytochrome c1 [Roseomonas acroporae]